MKITRKPQTRKQVLAVLLALGLLGSAAHSEAATGQGEGTARPSSSGAQRQRQAETISVPKGTHLAMVLTHPVDSRSLGHAGEIYAQLTAPVTVDGNVVIPAGTFLQGRVEKVVRHGTRGEFHMQSLSLVFPDGYVASFTEPTSIETTEGTVWLNPNGRTKAAAL